MANNHVFKTPTNAMTGTIIPKRADASGYQIITDEPGMTQYLYNGGSVEQPVKITIRSNGISDVGGVKVVNKPTNKSGAVQYSIKLETIGRRSNPVVANAVEDEAIALWLTIKHGANDQWNADDLLEMFRVLLGLTAKADVSSAGALDSSKFRFADLAKGITKM